MNEHSPIVELGATDLVTLYREMLRIRTIEEEIAARYAEQKMRCPIHLSIGQEAIAVGVSAALSREDQAVSTHRCHAHYIAKGGDIVAMLAEMMGKATGCCGGRGGSMHLFDLDAGLLLSLPIVAASIPVGVGAALAFKQENKPNVAVIYLGDASLEEGVLSRERELRGAEEVAGDLRLREQSVFRLYQPARPAAAAPADRARSRPRHADRAYRRQRRGRGLSHDGCRDCARPRWRRPDLHPRRYLSLARALRAKLRQ